MDNISQIKNTLNIVDIVGSYVELKKAGKNYKGACPFHHDKSPSFMVSPDLQIFKCFGCGEAGDIFEFIQKIEGIEFYDALKLLATKAGVELEQNNIDPKSGEKKLIFTLNELATEFFTHLLTKHEIGKDALEYLKKKRNLSSKTIQEFRLGYAPNSWDLLIRYLTKKGYKTEQMLEAGLITKASNGNMIDKFRNRIMFPLTVTGNKVIAFTGRSVDSTEPKYLNSPETIIFNKSSYLYGLDKAVVEIKKAGALIVEGQMDLISCHQSNIKNVVATSGTSLTNAHLKILSRFTQDITFCFDADEAGKSAVMRAIEMSENNDFNTKIAVLPKDTKDIDELIKDDLTKAIDVINNAIPIYDYLILQAVKKHDLNSAVGKKKILEDISENFSKIKNKVLKSHYINKLSEITSLPADIIEEAVFNKKLEKLENLSVTVTPSTNAKKQESLEEYMLGLIFIAPLDLSQNMLYKLGKNDFGSEKLASIFTAYKDYTLGRKKEVNLGVFAKKLEKDLQNIIEAIALKDYELVLKTQAGFEKEIQTTFKRLKLAKIDQELDDLNIKMKEAEKIQDIKEIESLQQKVNKISKLKNQYN